MLKGENDCVPCGLCGTPTPMTGTKRCDSCWEIETRISNPAGRAIALKVLSLTPADVFTTGESATLSRALRMYAAKYGEMAGREKDPGQKENLLGYVAAADRLLARIDAHLQHPPAASPAGGLFERHSDELAKAKGKKIGFLKLVALVARQYEEMLGLARRLERGER